MKQRLTYQNGKKRSLGLVVLLMMSMLMLPTVSMADDFVEGGLYYSTLSDITVEVVKPTSGKYEGNITIPESVIHDGTKYWVTAIGDKAFQAAYGLTSVTLPLTTITSIGKYAFNDCTGLTEFTLPASVTSIGQRAFYCCDNLKHLYVHSTVPASYNPGSEAFSYIHYGSHVCTLHVPTGCTAAYTADGSPFKSFTQVEQFDPPQVYELWVAGTRVTDANAADILGDKVASYDASTKTLTIGGDITVTGSDYIYGSGIYSGINNLTVLVSAPSTITVSETGIYFDDNGTITGSSLLTITSTFSNTAIYANGNLTIKDAHLDLIGEFWGDSNTTLNIIQSSTVSVKGCVAGWDAVTLDGCYFETPGKGVYDTTDKYVEDKDGNWAFKVVVKPGATPEYYYDLWVAGTMVNSYNASDILGDGAASYDASTKTLTISGDITNGISSSIDDLTVLVSKPSTITGEVEGLYFYKPTTITGAPLLTIKTLENWAAAIYTEEELTIKNANLVVMNDMWGGGSGSLTIISSSVDVSSDNNLGAICNLTELILDDCYIDTPKDYEFNGSLVDKNGDYVMTVSIRPSYDLYVGGKLVTDKNASDILGKGIASYDPSTNTLTIGGNISAYGSDVEGRGISSGIEDLTVLVSAPTIIAATEAGMYFTKNTTITGSSLLTITCSDDHAIVATDADLTIKDAQLNLTGQLRNFAHGILTIQSSTVEVTTTYAESAIFDWDVLSLKDCRIETPEEGVYDNIDRRVEDKNGDGVKSVKIGFFKLANDLAFSEASSTATFSQPFTEPILSNPHSLAVTYTSSNAEVATVDGNTGEVTLVSVGAATITASFAGDETYKAGDVSYELTVAPKTIDAPTIILSKNSFFYDGTAKEPEVTVKDGETVIPDTEYTIEYIDNTYIGKAIVNITDWVGGNYIVGGSTTFEIVLKGDANGDNKVDAADIVEMVNDMNGHPSEIFKKNNADIDGNGQITDYDINEVAKIILSIE